MTEPQGKTLYENILDKLKDNPVIVFFMVIAFIVAGVATFQQNLCSILPDICNSPLSEPTIAQVRPILNVDQQQFGFEITVNNPLPEPILLKRIEVLTDIIEFQRIYSCGEDNVLGQGGGIFLEIGTITVVDTQGGNLTFIGAFQELGQANAGDVESGAEAAIFYPILHSYSCDSGLSLQLEVSINLKGNDNSSFLVTLPQDEPLIADMSQPNLQEARIILYADQFPDGILVYPKPIE